MLSCYSIFIQTLTGKREILVTPFLLQSKEAPKLKSGKLEKLFFYENWIDEEYKENLSLEYLPDQFKTSDYIINFGQDFNRYYLGGLAVDGDTKQCRALDNPTDKLSEDNFKIISDSLFNNDLETHHIVVFTPTRPSDFNLAKI